MALKLAWRVVNTVRTHENSKTIKGNTFEEVLGMKQSKERKGQICNLMHILWDKA